MRLEESVHRADLRGAGVLDGSRFSKSRLGDFDVVVMIELFGGELPVGVERFVGETDLDDL